MANKHMKRCSAVVIREMQIKTTMRCHFTSVRMAIIQEIENNTCRRGCEGIGTLSYCCWECEKVWLLWKIVSQIIQQRSSIKSSNCISGCISKRTESRDLSRHFFPLCRGLTFNRSQRGSSSATYETQPRSRSSMYGLAPGSPPIILVAGLARGRPPEMDIVSHHCSQQNVSSSLLLNSKFFTIVLNIAKTWIFHSIIHNGQKVETTQMTINQCDRNITPNKSNKILIRTTT